MAHEHHHEEHGIPLLPPEERDANIGVVVWTGIGVLLFMVFCVFLAKLHYNYEVGQQPVAEPMGFSTDPRLPPEPRLQALPAKDLAAFREHQSHVTETFGWVDKAAGVARVPVDKAIDMVLEKGLPLRTAENEKTALAAALKNAAAKAAAEAKAKPEAKK